MDNSRSDKKHERLYLCRANGEGSHEFRICADEAAVMVFYEEMFGLDMDGKLDGAIEHFRDPDNWSNGGEAYHCELYCATFEVWKVTPSEMSRVPSSTAPQEKLEDLARWVIGYLGPLQRDDLALPAVEYIAGQLAAAPFRRCESCDSPSRCGTENKCYLFAPSATMRWDRRYIVLRDWLTKRDYFIKGLPQANTPDEVDAIIDAEIERR